MLFHNSGRFINEILKAADPKFDVVSMSIVYDKEDGRSSLDDIISKF